jgi:hypothetical protein
MNRHSTIALLPGALAALLVGLLAAGCGSSSGKPTKVVRVPQPGMAAPAT